MLRKKDRVLLILDKRSGDFDPTGTLNETGCLISSSLWCLEGSHSEFFETPKTKRDNFVKDSTGTLLRTQSVYLVST